MKVSTLHSYPSIFNLGHRAVAGLLGGPVIVEEKIDGSQFSFGVTVDGEIVTRSKGAAHTNSVESVWAVLKRGVHGVYHHVIPKHLARYVDEYSFQRGPTTGNRISTKNTETVRPADAEMMAAAEAAYPQEWIAALFGNNGEIQKVLHLHNLSEYPLSVFSVPPEELIEACGLMRGRQLIGFAHSHPDGDEHLSWQDSEDLLPCLLYVVVPVLAGRAQRPVYHQL